MVIEECVFRARRVTVAPSVMMSHNQALQQTTAKYPINRIDCKVVSVPRGNEQELERVHKSETDYYRVEKVLRTRMRNKRKEYFVKWLGYPEKFNSWVPAEHVKGV